MNRRGFTLIELLVLLAIIAALGAALLAYCNRSGPLTEQDGRDAAEQIHGRLLELIGTSTTPVDTIVARIRTDLNSQIEGIRNRPGITAFTRGMCAQLITLTENRIRSTPDAVERRRLSDFLARLREICRELQRTVTEPPTGQ